jgi:hypothetical protein
MAGKASTARRTSPDLIDVFIILLLASAIDIFVFTMATQFIGSSTFERLPTFLTDAYSAIWTSAASGAAGIGLLIVKTLALRRQEHPNYFLLALAAALTLMVAVIAMAVASKFLNPAPAAALPLGVSIIDTTDKNARSTDFEFSSLPGSLVRHRLKGSYFFRDGEVFGEMTDGFMSPTEQFTPAFPVTATRLFFRACYLHPIYGVDQMDTFPFVGNSTNSVDLNIKLEKGASYKLPSTKFSFKLPPEARPGRTWLCAAIENTMGGYFPAQ